jgi:hypothetical protein
MGRGDNRHSLKMRQRTAQKKKKDRLKRQIEAGQKQSGGPSKSKTKK